jgi:quercetin dioxygenase-like cupin family protein
MRRVLFLAAFVFAIAIPVMAQDPVKVDSKHYKVEFENARVRVLRVHYGPHEKSVWHWHPAGVAIAQTDAHVKFSLPGGKSEEREMKAGQTMWTTAGRHLPENLGDSDFEVILVELKTARRRAAKNPTSAPAAPTPAKQ